MFHFRVMINVLYVAHILNKQNGRKQVRRLKNLYIL